MRTARALSALTGLLVTLPLASCGVFDSGPSAEDAAAAYLRDFAAGDNAAAARRTDAPETARKFLGETRRNLSPEKVEASVTGVDSGDGGSPTTAKFRASWKFGSDRVWNYDGELELRENEDSWKVHWQPSVVHPELGSGQSLHYQLDPATPAPVLGRDGTRLMGPQRLIRVTVVRKEVDNLSEVAGSLARGLEPVAPSVTKRGIVEGAKDTPENQAYTVVTLRLSDYRRVKSAIYELPGVRFPDRTALVASEQDYASQVLPAISENRKDRLNGSDGWRVFTANSSGAELKTLHRAEPQPTEALRTTLSDKVQRAAENAVDPIDKPAMIVAMRPSSGGVLAVAQNKAADDKGALALTGQYPPGSTFKMATALATLEAGEADIGTKLGCPAERTFNGKTLPNAHHFDLGRVTMKKAFAESCNTTFAGLASRLPASALPTAAEKLGIGADFAIPGITTLTGEVPSSEDEVTRAVNGIGQGKVLASPFGMALASASVAHGSMPTPKLLESAETRVNEQAKRAPSEQALRKLREMMREVVRSGTATELSGLGEVAGKTGTAQFGDGSRAHGWFTGYRGDLSFAVLVTDAGTSERAVRVSKKFLDGVG
ncbi:Cell division protein FtsI/penicillin-binding protein 2 [Actinopolyspora alba]|uniref:Cell division protein FtsI/penicillin-binding protein 2 n=1 Tax=Actinopolyspora alba TaxID=673379 RepID=A0A1I1V354_9ACTN|nr:penicillin-binding transpeptidase domain-containing protein [Actinopolyspora alba]SFD76438.1 Cell division protein FtsI/penicillin-binding protein 2 [Actinopolyspora alba]